MPVMQVNKAKKSTGVALTAALANGRKRKTREDDKTEALPAPKKRGDGRHISEVLREEGIPSTLRFHGKPAIQPDIEGKNKKTFSLNQECQIAEEGKPPLTVAQVEVYHHKDEVGETQSTHILRLDQEQGKKTRRGVMMSEEAVAEFEKIKSGELTGFSQPISEEIATDFNSPYKIYKEGKDRVNGDYAEQHTFITPEKTPAPAVITPEKTPAPAVIVQERMSFDVASLSSRAVSEVPSEEPSSKPVALKIDPKKFAHFEIQRLVAKHGLPPKLQEELTGLKTQLENRTLELDMTKEEIEKIKPQLTAQTQELATTKESLTGSEKHVDDLKRELEMTKRLLTAPQKEELEKLNNTHANLDEGKKNLWF